MIEAGPETATPDARSGKRLETERRAARKALFLYIAKCMAEDPNPYGELIGSDEAIARFGVTGQQLNEWRRDNKIIYFGLSRKKRRFPTEQFCKGGTVVPGIDRLVTVIGFRGETWLFLIQPHYAFDGQRPIDLLKAGKVERVVAAAARHYEVEAWQ